MWMVKNRLRATLTLRGAGVTIPAGAELDIDAALGRERAEASNQLQVAFEEGWLENLHKAPRPGGSGQGSAHEGVTPPAGLSGDDLDRWKRGFMAELKEQLPQVASAASSSQLEQVRAAISSDVQQLVGELKLMRERFESTRAQVRHDPKLSDAEIKARLAFLEEQEQQLLRNFETVGRRLETPSGDDGDVMDKADLLSNI